jgi:hypothetical protein
MPKFIKLAFLAVSLSFMTGCMTTQKAANPKEKTAKERNPKEKITKERIKKQTTPKSKRSPIDQSYALYDTNTRMDQDILRRGALARGAGFND